MSNNFNAESQQTRFRKGKEKDVNEIQQGSHSRSITHPIGLRNDVRQRADKDGPMDSNQEDGHDKRRVDNELHEGLGQTWAIPQASQSVKATTCWEDFHFLMKDYDDAMCNAWREELQNLLIFAGLFSAIVTAFVVESYQWLQPESSDATTQYLSFLTVQFAQAQNITLPEPLSQLNTPQEVTSSAIRINIFWFLSLILSLSAALIGILGYQWLREFQAEAPSLPHKEAVALRQVKFNGLQSWNIPDILSTVPLLLQIALVLFFGGVLDLLWHYNHVVAAVTTVAVGGIILFLVVTTVTPALQHVLCRRWWAEHRIRAIGDPFRKLLHPLVPQCPFKSTQSWLILRLALWIRTLQRKIGSSVIRNKDVHDNLTCDNFFDWITYELNWQRRNHVGYASEGQLAIPAAIDWVHTTWSQNAGAIRLIDECLDDPNIDSPLLLLVWFEDHALSIDPSQLREFLCFKLDTESYRTAKSALFLSLHVEQHPPLRPKWVKAMLQTLSNLTASHPPRFDLLQGMPHQNSWVSWVLKYISENLDMYEPEAMIQAVSYLHLHCNTRWGTIDAKCIRFGWKILSQLCWNDEYRRDMNDLNAQHLSFACRVSGTFHALLRSRMNWNLTEQFAVSLSYFFYNLNQKDILTLSQTFPEFTNIINLVKFIETILEEGQLTQESWYSDYWLKVIPKFAHFNVNEGWGTGSWAEEEVNMDERLNLQARQISLATCMEIIFLFILPKFIDPVREALGSDS